MDQYHFDRPPTTAIDSHKSLAEQASAEKEINRLKSTVVAQQQQIDDLIIEVRRLKNELRSAVSAFNLKRG